MVLNFTQILVSKIFFTERLENKITGTTAKLDGHPFGDQMNYVLLWLRDKSSTALLGGDWSHLEELLLKQETCIPE